MTWRVLRGHSVWALRYFVIPGLQSYDSLRLELGMADEVRVLLVADSHLGFDLPVRPRVERRRRGHDFLANYARALAPALAGEVDAVVHAGDVFDRSSVVSTLAYQAFEPLRRVADLGIPVMVVPGNHERS